MEAHNNLGAALLQKGRTDEAIAQYQKTLELMPDCVEAHYNLGLTLGQQGSALDAAAHWREAARLQPGNIVILNSLARLLAIHPDQAVRNGAEALTLAQRAVELSGDRDPAILDTLAAAYAETGRFSAAVATARRALSLASAQGNAPLANALRSHIKLYQAGAPLRGDELLK